MLAGNILSNNDLLDFSFKFFENLVDINPIYSIQLQKKIIETLSTLQNKGRLTPKKIIKKMHVAFSMLAFMYLQYVQITLRILECLTRTLRLPNLAGMALG